MEGSVQAFLQWFETCRELGLSPHDRGLECVFDVMGAERRFNGTSGRVRGRHVWSCLLSSEWFSANPECDFP